MKPTYYTPELREFHEGFEYQELWNDKPDNFPDGYWKERTFNFDRAINKFRIERGDFRVKHLNHDDIITAGWTLNSRYADEDGHNRDAGYHIREDYNDIEISFNGREGCSFHLLGQTSANQVDLYIDIKNKSELLFFMQRLGITD